MKKKIGCILLSVVFALSLAGCKENEEAKQIEELKALIAEQSQTLAQLNGSLSDLQSAFQTQTNTLEELQATANAQAEEIEYLQYKTKILSEEITVKTYDLKTAYENYQIDLETVKHISYYMTGKVYKVSASELENHNLWTEIEFVPTQVLEPINPIIKRLIQDVLYKDGGWEDPRDIGFAYYGNYNGRYAFRPYNNSSQTAPDVTYYYSVDGIGITDTSFLTQIFFLDYNIY